MARGLRLDSRVLWFCAGAVAASVCYLLPLLKKLPAIASDAASGPVDGAPAVAGPPKAARRKVVCFGDSITQQGFIVENKGWVAQLADWWTRKVDVVNRGFSGYTSRLALAMVEDVVVREQPDMVIIFYGANDAALPSSPQHVAVDEYKSNLVSIVAALRKYRPALPIILITPPPFHEPSWKAECIRKGYCSGDRANAATKTYVAACEEVGKQVTVPVINAYNKMQGDDADACETFLSDGLHLNRKGNDVIFNELQETIRAHYPAFDSDGLQMHKPEWHAVISREDYRSVLAS